MKAENYTEWEESQIGYRKKQEEQEQHCREQDDELQPRKTAADFSLLLRLFPLSLRVRGGDEGGEHAVAGRVLYRTRLLIRFLYLQITSSCLEASYSIAIRQL